MEEKLREYAHLIVSVGLNLQKGQTLILSSPVECAPFARLCVSAAYDLGAGEVVLNWTDDCITRERFLRAQDAAFEMPRPWRRAFFTDYANEGAAYLRIDAEDPETPAGVGFVANLPTEEIFTAPLKTGVNGTVCAALPLVNNGSIIEDIRFTVREGRIVEARASRGEDVLNAAIAVDDGARYFGEVALVPYDSPIRSSGLLFYNTLYDENASCHLAFGEAYPECIAGGERMTREELDAHGLNHSLTHVDFMVGTADLSITGTTHDGRELPVFRSGNFAL